MLSFINHLLNNKADYVVTQAKTWGTTGAVIAIVLAVVCLALAFVLISDKRYGSAVQTSVMTVGLCAYAVFVLEKSWSVLHTVSVLTEAAGVAVLCVSFLAYAVIMLVAAAPRRPGTHRVR